MIIEETSLPGVVLIKPQKFGDSRGYFVETYNKKRFAEQNLAMTFVQDNLSRSSKGVLRGLHYQRDFPQGKLVRVSSGEVFDVAVDIRQGSSTFGRWYGVNLSEENQWQLYIPPGFAHGFCVLSDIALFEYKCTEFYHPEDEYGISWNDPEINIDWPVSNPVLSDKDRDNPGLLSVDYRNLPVLSSSADKS